MKMCYHGHSTFGTQYAETQYMVTTITIVVICSVAQPGFKNEGPIL